LRRLEAILREMSQPSESTSQVQPLPRKSLEYLAQEQELLCARMLELTPNELELASDLPGWSVFDLAVHITRVCDSILLAVQRASVGDRTPAFGAAARPREEAIRAMSPQGWVDLQRTARAELTRLVAGMADAQLNEFHFPHPQGDRTVRWFCTQLLTEVTFHRWDLGRALGESRPLEEGLARYLLPFMLDSAQPLYAHLRAPRPTSFALVTTDDGWQVLASGQGTVVRRDRSTANAQATIRADAGWLALAVYGRVRVDDSPSFEVEGPPETADQFAAVFGPRAQPA
jgi:uncharacterized protein (TIGR03083 family)